MESLIVPCREAAEPAALAARSVPETDGRELWRESLRLWLQWNQAHDALTAAMFDSRQDRARQSKLIEQMDQLDQLRWRAVELAQELLGH